jgi:hypothetical protein
MQYDRSEGGHVVPAKAAADVLALLRDGEAVEP